MPDPHCCGDSATESCRRSLSGTTSGLSMDDLFAAWWTSSVQDSPASHSHSPATKKRRRTSATAGPTPSASFARYDRPSRCWRTFQGSSADGTATWASCSVTWPQQGSMRSGVCSERPTSEPRTAANDSGFWPTPCATEPAKNLSNYGDKLAQPRSERGGGCGPNLATAVTMYPTPRLNTGPGTGRHLSLDSAVLMVPTPSASDGRQGGTITSQMTGTSLPQHIRAMYPTPTASETRGGPEHPDKRRAGHHSPKLRDVVAFPTPTVVDSRGGRNATARRTDPESQHHHGVTLIDAVVPPGAALNPDWVEWLMGWPVGWTATGPLSPETFRGWLRASMTAFRG